LQEENKEGFIKIMHFAF